MKSIRFVRPFAIAALLCLGVVGALAAQQPPAPMSSQSCATAVEDLLETLEAPVSTLEGRPEVLIEDPLHGAVYKAIDSGVCCSSSSGCQSIAGYSKRCSSGSCTSKNTCLYTRL
ncbi:MAG TPA: hypothetical protein VF789_22990 [Thermoanaerobaculia bacterium]